MACNKSALTLCLLLTLLLLPLATPAVQDAPPLTPEDLEVLLGETVFSLDVPAAPLLRALDQKGIRLTVREVDSCLFPGKDREFSDEQILIGTLPRGARGADVVETIMALGGEYMTRRGIGIGSTGQDVLAAYGEAALKDYDLLIYCLPGQPDGPWLVFVMDLEKDAVLSFYAVLNTQG